MSTVRARRIANVVVVATFAFQVISTVLTIVRSDYTGNNSFDLVYAALTFVGAGVYLWVGRMIVSRQPSNTVGWLLLSIPLIACFTFANGSYATWALVNHRGTLPFGVASAWIDRWAIVPMLAALIPIFLLYPNGHLPSRRWRPALWLTIASPTLASLAFALTPGRMTGAMANLETVHVTNPLGVSAAGALIDQLTTIGSIGMLLAAIVACAAIVVRYRGADGETRQQVRWLAFVGVAFFVEFLITAVGSGLTHDSDNFGNVMFLVWFITLVLGTPIACGIAILKYRLYDLDVVVRKTVVFGLLAAFITALYAVVVGGIGAIVGAKSSTVLSFAAAALLAVAFQPARDRARRLADRLAYGQRATPYEVLAEFSERMSESYATEDVLPRMAEILRAGTGATSAGVWLRVGSSLRPEAAAGEPLERAPVAIEGDTLPEFSREHAVEVRHQGEFLGALSVRMPPSDPMDPAKDKLVLDLASQAGLVLRNVRLIEELRASRQRLVAAQDEERRKIERNLHDGAQQQLVALSVKLRLAEQLAERDPAKAKEMLAGLQNDTTEALEDLRDLARGIYPPLLADRGLAPALEAQARKSAVPTSVESGGVGRYAPEVEATIYFCTLEALQNVAKYAAATRAQIRLGREDGHVTFEIEDDGAGFDPSITEYGTGLRGMADRLDAIGGSLEVRSAPGRGTTIAGRLPITTRVGTP
jgi:signal transduction histidine kinase